MRFFIIMELTKGSVFLLRKRAWGPPNALLREEPVVR